MKILFFGDIVGRPGREAIKKILPELKKKYEPDLVLANGENLSHGRGISLSGFKELRESGIDWLTSGNHAFARKEAKEIFEDKNQPILRPANWPKGAPGRGYEIINLRSKKILLINLIGRVYMAQQFNDPFACVDNILEDYSLVKSAGCDKVDEIIVDWHAEASSEKMVMGWYLDGRVSAVLGTHTHVGTDDAQILPQGTAYVSDIGMVGPKNSVLGVDKEIVLKRFLTQMPHQMEVAQGPVLVNAVLLTLDDAAGLAQNIEKIRDIVEV